MFPLQESLDAAAPATAADVVRGPAQYHESAGYSQPMLLGEEIRRCAVPDLDPSNNTDAQSWENFCCAVEYLANAMGMGCKIACQRARGIDYAPLPNDPDVWKTNGFEILSVAIKDEGNHPDARVHRDMRRLTAWAITLLIRKMAEAVRAGKEIEMTEACGIIKTPDDALKRFRRTVDGSWKLTIFIPPDPGELPDPRAERIPPR